VGISRPTYYYKPKVSRPNGTDLADRIEEIALEYPSYGYRRITAELRRLFSVDLASFGYILFPQ